MSVLMDIVVKTSLIFLLALAVMPLLRRRSAALRHWVLSAALMCAVAFPILQLVVPTWMPVDVPSLVVDVMQVERLDRTSLSSRVEVVAAPRSPAAALAPAFPWTSALLATWIIGMIACLAILVVGFLRLSMLTSRAKPIEDGVWVDSVDRVRRAHAIERPVRLLHSSDPTLLITWGLWRPKLIVPNAARQWREDRVALVVDHELAHIRRGDWIVQLGAELMRAIYWFNPLVWLMCTRLRHESEQACDDVVICRGVNGSEYATHLLEIARGLQTRGIAFPAPAIARASSLERRVKAMLDTRLDRRPLSRRACVMLLLALLSVTTVIAAVTAQGFASVTGSIVDPTNGVLPGVTLVLTNDQNNAKYELRSDRNGRYEFVGVPPGDYVLEARIPGFAKFQGRLTLSGQNVQQDLTLQVGSLQETVTVRAGDHDGPAPADPVKERELEEKRQKRAAAACSGIASDSPTRIGGNIRTPMKIRHINPHYPASLRESNIEGTVVLQGRIGTDGLMGPLEVVSAAHPELANAAVAAVSQWQFDQTLLNCVAQEVSITVTVNYLR